MNNIITVIGKLAEVLDMIKDFRAGYSTKNMSKGLMLFDYKDRRYAIKIVEIEDPNIDAAKDIDNLDYIKF